MRSFLPAPRVGARTQTMALAVTGLLWTLGGMTTVRAAPAAPDFRLVGFAAVPGDGMGATTGGGDAPPVTVRTARELRAALERLDIPDAKRREATPRVVRVAADIDLGELANGPPGDQLKRVGVVHVASHTTVYAPGAGATIRHGTLEIHGAHDVILRNLAFRDLWEPDPTGEYDELGWDSVRITNAGKTFSHHVWVDHCDFGKVYDGMVDITHGSDLITVSWCRFAGDARGPQKKVSLIGHSSSTNAAATDRGRLNVTFHHNLFQNIGDRAPRARFGNVHVFNDFVDGAENATISVTGAVTLVENCVYRDTRIATSFSHAEDNAAKGRAGTLCLVNSRNDAPRPNRPSGRPETQFEIKNNFTSSVPRQKLQFNAPADFAWTDRAALPYIYAPDPVALVPALVTKFAGAGKLPESAFQAAHVQAGDHGRLRPLVVGQVFSWHNGGRRF